MNAPADAAGSTGTAPEAETASEARTASEAEAAGRTAAVRAPYRSTTRRALMALRNCLLVTTVLMLITSLWALQQVSGNVERLRTRSAPAILEIAAAQKALAAADRAAIESFEVQDSRLTGFRPGEAYQNQIGIANQSLAQVAEDNAAGEAGSGEIQLIEGTLVVYTGLIGQAEAHYQEHDTALGVTSLWYASDLMHNPSGGILAQLDELRIKQERALGLQLSSGWRDPLIVLAWAGPGAVLFTLLLAAQLFVRRRFRRLLNLPLLSATVLLVAGLVVAGALALRSEGHLVHARTALHQAVANRRAEVQAADAAMRQALATLLSDKCRKTLDGCGPTIRRFGAMEPEPGGTAAGKTTGKAAGKASGQPPADDGTSVQEINDSKLVYEQTEAGRIGPVLTVLLLTVSLAALGLIIWGFQARIEEYRFQP